MTIKDGFMLREIAGQWIVFPVGEKIVDFNGIIALSASGALLWKKILAGAEEDQLINEIVNVYEIDEVTAKHDVMDFLLQMKTNGILE